MAGMRGLRGRRMALLDEHWLVGAEFLGAPGWRERWARRAPLASVVFDEGWGQPADWLDQPAAA